MPMERRPADQSMRVGLFYQNAPSVHLASRTANDLNPDVLDLDMHARLARVCEDGGLDFLFIADQWGRRGSNLTRSRLGDPSVLAPLLAVALFAATRQIGVVTTLHTSWFHPVAAARIGANLDALSRGRWGINVVTGGGFAETLLRGANPVADHDERYAMAAEALDIMKTLWRGEPCSVAGKYFQVEGEMVGPAVVQQPYPAIFSAGASPAGRRFAARQADWIFIPGRMTHAEALRRIDQLRDECEQAGRPPESLRIMRHVSILVRESGEEARRVSGWLRSTVDLPAAREYVSEIREFATTYRDVYRDYVDEDEVIRSVGVSSGAVQFHGSPEEVAERIRDLYTSGVCHGIAMTFPLWHAEEIARFTRLVLPILETMGIWTSPHRRGWCW